MENVLEVLFSVRFVFVFLSQGRFLRRALGRVVALIGGVCFLWLCFSRGHVCLRRCGLCTVDRCEHCGRLQGRERKGSVR